MTRGAPPPLPLVLVDKAEQYPLEPTVMHEGEPIALPTTRADLATGDYSLPGLEDQIAFETKRGDYLTTLFGSSATSTGEARSSQDRFREELLRMREMALAAVVIEREPRDIWRDARGRAFDPGAAWSLFISLYTDYGVPFYWFDRATAALHVGSCLTRVWRQHIGHDRAYRKAEARGVLRPWVRATPTTEALEATARGVLRLEQMRAIDAADEAGLRALEGKLVAARAAERSDEGDDLARVRRRLRALAVMDELFTGRTPALDAHLRDNPGDRMHASAPPSGTRRFAEAGGMPLSTSAADAARRAARRMR